MDFIKVTLFQKLDPGITIANMQKQAGYLLPVNAIKSVTKKMDVAESSNSYSIVILESFRPDDVDVNVSHAEADLPSDFFQIQN